MSASLEKNAQTVLVCKIGNLSVAFPSTEILEILPPRPVSLIPLTPRYAIGAFIFRELSTSVIDLRKKFRLDKPMENTKSVFIITQLSESKAAAFYVDEIRESQTLPDEKISTLFASNTYSTSQLGDETVYFTHLSHLLHADRDFFIEAEGNNSVHTVDPSDLNLVTVSEPLKRKQYDYVNIVSVGRRDEAPLANDEDNILSTEENEIVENIEVELLDDEDKAHSVTSSVLGVIKILGSHSNRYLIIDDQYIIKSNPNLSPGLAEQQKENESPDSNDISKGEEKYDDYIAEMSAEKSTSAHGHGLSSRNKKRMFSIVASVGVIVLSVAFFFLRESDIQPTSQFINENIEEPMQIDTLREPDSNPANPVTGTGKQIGVGAIGIDPKSQPIMTPEHSKQELTTTNNLDSTIVTSPETIGVPNSTTSIQHIVRKGDTLWGIADHYLENPFLYNNVARDNNVKNPDVIFPKQSLQIRKKTQK